MSYLVTFALKPYLGFIASIIPSIVEISGGGHDLLGALSHGKGQELYGWEPWVEMIAWSLVAYLERTVEDGV